MADYNNKNWFLIYQTQRIIEITVPHIQHIGYYFIRYKIDTFILNENERRAGRVFL